MNGSPFAADKRRGFRLWRQRARRRTQKSEGSANENGTNDENADENGDEKVCTLTLAFEKYKQSAFLIKYCSGSVVLDHVAIVLAAIVVNDNKTKAKKVVRSLVKMKLLAMTVVRSRVIRTDVDDAFSDEISVNASPVMERMPMAVVAESKKMVQMAMVRTVMTIVGHAIAASDHVIDQIKVAMAIKYV